jgi:hypothetical protein
MSLVYLTLSVGVQLYKHYCCGKLKEVSFSENEHRCCAPEKGCSFGSKCCDTETVVFKIDDEHRDSERMSVSVPDYVNIYVPVISHVVDILPHHAEYAFSGNDPPPVTEKYNLFCARIVYG